MGALRTGSTYLASLLDRHPRICLADPKEPGFFTRNGERGLEWYRNCFKVQQDNILLDATAWYSAGPTARFPLAGPDDESAYAGVAKKIHALSPGAKFIYIVRDPAERAYSLYWFLRRSGTELGSFLQAVHENPLYLRSSDYRGQLEEFLRFFPTERFQIIAFEQVIASPQEMANRCFQFLGLEAFDIDTLARHHERNASHQYRALPRIAARALGKPDLVEQVYRGATKLTPPLLHRFWHSLLFRSPPRISNKEREFFMTQLLHTPQGPDLPIAGFGHVRQWESPQIAQRQPGHQA